ncbi:unnamed protein product, partial [Pleuronectes platessa]
MAGVLSLLTVAGVLTSSVPSLHPLCVCPPSDPFGGVQPLWSIRLSLEYHCHDNTFCRGKLFFSVLTRFGTGRYRKAWTGEFGKSGETPDPNPQWPSLSLMSGTATHSGDMKRSPESMKRPEMLSFLPLPSSLPPVLPSSRPLPPSLQSLRLISQPDCSPACELVLHPPGCWLQLDPCNCRHRHGEHNLTGFSRCALSLVHVRRRRRCSHLHVPLRKSSCDLAIDQLANPLDALNLSPTGLQATLCPASVKIPPHSEADRRVCPGCRPPPPTPGWESGSDVDFICYLLSLRWYQQVHAGHPGRRGDGQRYRPLAHIVMFPPRWPGDLNNGPLANDVSAPSPPLHQVESHLINRDVL